MAAKDEMSHAAKPTLPLKTFSQVWDLPHRNKRGKPRQTDAVVPGRVPGRGGSLWGAFGHEGVGFSLSHGVPDLDFKDNMCLGKIR